MEKDRPKEPVCLGSISDPYQPIEKKYEITRKMLEVCDELSYPVFIVTKSDIVMRDKDMLHFNSESSVAGSDIHVFSLDLGLFIFYTSK